MMQSRRMWPPTTPPSPCCPLCQGLHTFNDHPRSTRLAPADWR